MNMKKIAAAYKSYLGENLVSIALFGSRARGEAKKESDYDILIISENLPDRYYERVRYIRKPVLAFEEKISVIAKTKQEFESSLPSLYLDVALDGKILFDKRHYLEEKLKNIREIIEKAGLNRKKIGREFIWSWMKQKKPGWELEWSGLVEV